MSEFAGSGPYRENSVPVGVAAREYVDQLLDLLETLPDERFCAHGTWRTDMRSLERTDYIVVHLDGPSCDSSKNPYRMLPWRGATLILEGCWPLQCIDAAQEARLLRAYQARWLKQQGDRIARALRKNGG